MLKFFRKIRHGLLRENRLAKYLLYAAGEIVLVVIGILLALNLNNRNEQRKTEARIEGIFSEIMEELITDIEQTNMPMNYWALRDSTMYMVIQDRVTYEDFRENRLPWINNLLGYFSKVDLTQEAYNNLVSDLNAVPPRFKPVIAELNTLYKINKQYIEEATEELSKFINAYRTYGMLNYPWFYGRNNEEREQIIKYKMEDFRYKNQVEEFRVLGTFNQLRQSIAYRKKAIDCYKQIAALLNKPTVHDSFGFDPDLANILLGDWYIEGDPEIIITFYLEENRLFNKNNVNKRTNEIYYVPRVNKILDSDVNYATLHQEEGKNILKYYDFSLVKVK